MDDAKIKELIKEDLLREEKELMDLVNSDPRVRDAEPPEEMRENIFKKIRELEEQNSQNPITEEEKELIRLGKKYKKNTKVMKYVVVLIALVGILGVGTTCFGGPKRVFEEVKRTIAGREQNRVNTDDERIDAVETVSEAEAYEKIEREFGFYPVSFDYLPENMKFVEMFLWKDIQTIQFLYEDGQGGTITYQMTLNYRPISSSTDIEDELVAETEKDIMGVKVKLKQYLVGETKTERWISEFIYDEVSCSLMFTGVDETTVEEVIENLYFTKK